MKGVPDSAAEITGSRNLHHYRTGVGFGEVKVTTWSVRPDLSTHLEYSFHIEVRGIGDMRELGGRAGEY